MTQAVALFSGGLSSFFAAKRYAEEHPQGSLTLLFTDTMTEDEDLYRFLNEAKRWLMTVHGTGYKYLADGRSIWEVFKDEKLLGNTRMDPCSRILKRDLARKWIEENTEPETPLIMGFGWSEVHRHERAAARWAPRPVISPLLRPPYLTRADMMNLVVRDHGIEPPRLYTKGFEHNNCGGGCVKAGQGHFAHLLKVLPEVYDEWEANEQALRDELGNVSILRDRVGGETKPMTLATLRERIQLGQPIDMWDIGGCNCFEDDSA